MTRDEKAIWIAVFAARHETLAMQTLKCRGDSIITAIEEADYTILQMRRIADKSLGRSLHRIEPLPQEEEHGRGIDVSEPQNLGFAP